jgi:hypothetical protein
MLRRMSSASRLRCLVYGVVALAALVSTQIELVRHFRHGGDLGSFLTDPFVNPASSFLAIDIIAVATAAIAFMIFETRRLGLKRLWLYVALTFLLAISVSFPLFLIERERHLASAPQDR